ncbi:MAG: peptidase, partial [Massilia sp.]|nr:peptidase [Massilia sp.]
GHGYFYGILASNEFEEPVLDEGMNEYWDARMLRANRYAIHAATPLMQKLGIAPTFQPFDIERVAAPREEPADAPGQNAWDRLQGIGPVYTRSATVMRDLEAQIGSEAMERAMKAYYQRWKFRHPSVADLRESLAEASGQRAIVEAVFAQQIYKTSKVDDRVDALTSVEQLPGPGLRLVGGVRRESTADALEKQIEATRKQWKDQHGMATTALGPYPFETTVTLRRRGAPVPQTLVVRFADGSAETVRWDGADNWKRFTWVRPARAVSAELDPQRLHYLDVNKLDDSRTIEPDPRASRRWGADLAALFQALVALLANV